MKKTIFNSFLAFLFLCCTVVLAKDQIMVSKKWKAVPNSEVVLAKKSGGMQLSVLNEKEKTVRASVPLSFLSKCLIDNADEVSFENASCEEFKLDLGPYRVANGVIGIGVRWNLHSMYPAGESSDQWLALYQVKEKSLLKIFEAEMNYSASQRGPGVMLTGQCILNIKKTMTEGHFDLEQVCTNKVELMMEEESGTKKPPQITKESKRFVWKTSQYIEVKK